MWRVFKIVMAILVAINYFLIRKDKEERDRFNTFMLVMIWLNVMR